MFSVFFGFETNDQSLDQWSSAGCWPHLNHMLLQFTGFWQTCSCVSVSVGVSMLWCTGVAFVQPGVKVNGAYYCDVLLLKQLLPDICQAVGDFRIPAHHACARALSYCDTRLRISHQTSPPNKPDLSSVDYRLLSHSGMCLSEETSTGCQTSLMRCG